MGDFYLKGFVPLTTARQYTETYQCLKSLVINQLQVPSDLFPIGSEKAQKALCSRSAVDLLDEENQLDLKSFELPCNPSSFGAYASARQIVTKCKDRLKLIKAESTTTTEQKLVAVKREQPMRKMLQIGLRCLCDLLSDVRDVNPVICENALKSLSHIVESQKAEELASESKIVIDKLFALLQDIVTSADPSLGSVACKCLTSLAIAYGLPEYILCCSHTLLSSDRPNGSFLVDIPENFRVLYEAAYSKSLADNCRLWFGSVLDLTQPAFSVIPGSPLRHAVNQSKAPIGSTNSSPSSICSDGSFLYIITGTGLFKLGFGCLGTQRGHVYAFTRSYRASGLCTLSYCDGSLYLRRKGSVKLWALNPCNLECSRELVLQEQLAEGILASDGKLFCTICLDPADNLTLLVNYYDTSLRLPLQQETTTAPLSVTLKWCKTMVFGDHSSLFSLSEAMANLKGVLEDKIADIQIGTKTAVLLTTLGTVYYLGAGSCFDLPDSQDTWLELPVPGKVSKLFLSATGNNLLLLISAGQLYYCGAPARNEDGSARTLRKVAHAVRCKPMQPTSSESVVSAACNTATTAFVTTSGKLYVFGKDALNCNAATGEASGFEALPLNQVAVGKAHVVALSRKGAVYSFGMNNFGQCGRPELYLHQDSDSESCSSRTTTGSGHQGYEHNIATAATAAAQSATEVCQFALHVWSACKADDVAVQLRCPVCTNVSTTTTQQQQQQQYFSPQLKRPKSYTVATDKEQRNHCTVCGICNRCATKTNRRSAVDAGGGHDSDAEAKLGLVLPPGQVPLRTLSEQKAVQVSCGNYHNLVLTSTGKVFSFGNNRFGQLGLGHTKSVKGPELVLLPGRAVQVSAGANHSICRLADNQVLSFGKYDNGQLLRHSKDTQWFAVPGTIDGFDGKRITAISATGDCTMVTFEFPVLSRAALSNAYATLNRNFIFVFPRQTLPNLSYFAINRTNGRHKIFKSENNAFATSSICLDPSFDVLWCFDGERSLVSCYTAAHSSGNQLQQHKAELEPELAFLYNPEFWLPNQQQQHVSAAQLGLSMFSTYQLLHSQQKLRHSRYTSKHFLSQQQISGDSAAPTTLSYCAVTRFQGYGGGWGYSVQSIEAIQFSSDRDVLVLGYGLYGGRGEYTAKLKLFRIVDQDPEERNIELMDETEELQFECAPLERAHLLLSQPVFCNARDWYIACVSINGPSSDCGASGLPTMLGDDGTTFWFRNSRLSNNGTEVGAGQIPTILYRRPDSLSDTVCLDDDARAFFAAPSLANGACTSVSLSSAFFLAVTPACFQALLQLLRSSLLSLHSYLEPPGTAVDPMQVEKHQTVAVLALQTLQRFLKLVYPQSKSALECQEFILAVEESFQSVCYLLHCGDQELFSKHCDLLLNVCSHVFADCFYIFFPDASLVQYFLAENLKSVDPMRNWCLHALIMALEATDYPISCVIAAKTVPSFPHLTFHLQKVRAKPCLDSPLSYQTLFTLLLDVLFHESSSTGTAMHSPDVQRSAAMFLCKAVDELMQLSSSQDADASVVMQTPCRFNRQSLAMSWDTCNGSPDAIAFQVEGSGLTAHGVGIYGGSGNYNYSLELLVNRSSTDLTTSDQWTVIEKASGTLTTTAEDVGSICFLRLPKPVKLTEGVLYAFRVYVHGQRTWSGEGGTPYVYGVCGCKFTFHGCTLSLNGTNVVRGQIPVLLYSVASVARSCQAIAPDTASKWFLESLKLINERLVVYLSSKWYATSSSAAAGKCTVMSSLATFVTNILGFVVNFLEQNRGMCLEVLQMFEEVLPLITQQNLQLNRGAESTKNGGNNNNCYAQAVIESAHPYKLSQVCCYSSRFPSNVMYVTLEFDKRCSTAQVEDSLQVYVEFSAGKFTPVARFWGNSWPKQVVLLPGNCVWLVFETTSNYNRVEEANLFGFKCQITGYGCLSSDPLQLLEREFAYVYAYGCSLLFSGCLKPSLNPFKSSAGMDLSSLDDEANEMLKSHGCLLKKGLALDHLPTVKELRTGKIAFKQASSELNFLRDFIAASATTAGGKLAHWLTPEPFIDPQKCELLVECPRAQSGQPIVATVITKDQHSRIAFSEHSKIEVLISLVPQGESSDGGGDSTMTNNAAVAPSLLLSLQSEVSYQPTYLNKARYISVSMMKPFRGYSFEELRLAFVSGTQLKESLQTVSNCDGSYVAKWIPKHSGCYKLECNVDGFMVHKSHAVEVQDGNVVTQQLVKRASRLSVNKTATTTDRMTQGVRLRMAPTLLARQVGVIPRNSTVLFTEMLKNADGTWLKLSEESAVMFVGSRGANPSSVWCLQFNKHLNSTLLNCSPDSENDDKATMPVDAATNSVVIICEDRYVVTNCSQSGGHEIRKHPSKSAAVVGALGLNEEVRCSGWLQNADGIWVQLHRTSLENHVFSPDFEEGFALAKDFSGTIFLDRQLSREGSLSTSRPPILATTPAAGSSSHSSAKQTPAAAGEEIESVYVEFGQRQVGTQTFSNGNNSTGSTMLKESLRKRSIGNNKQQPPVDALPTTLFKPTVRVAPQNNAGGNNKYSAVQATSPSVAEAIRCVFAAFMWHEGLVHDAMAAASYLKFHPELSNLKSTVGGHRDHYAYIDDDEDTIDICPPATLQLTCSLWSEIYVAVQTVIEKHLILPSPPMALKTPYSEKQPTLRSKEEYLCELCEGWFLAPVSVHMRLAHRGCGQNCGGQGYNSLGKYTGGWSGICGDGGYGSSTWYLLCQRCRQTMLQSTASFREKQRKDKGRIFRISTGSVEPAKILRNNALFLLELNDTETSFLSQPESRLRPTAAWNINLFPTAGASTPMANGHAASNLTNVMSSSSHRSVSDSNYNYAAPTPAANMFPGNNVPHASDPGPKRKRVTDQFNMPSSEPLCTAAMCLSSTSKAKSVAPPDIMDSQVLISSPSLALRTTAAATARGLNSALKRPVISFVIQHHDLAHVKQAMQVSVMRSAAYAHAFQVLVWLLHSVTNQQCIEDILWCAIRGLSQELPEAGQAVTPRSGWALCLLSGPVCQQMLNQFHSFLHNTVTILRSPAVSLELQQKCLKCWLLGFIPYDQNLILSSRILQAINKIMSDNSTANNSCLKSFPPTFNVDVEQLDDVTSTAEIDVSSRKAMVACLTDQTTDTFWESGEEDRGCPKFIRILLPAAQVSPKLLAIHVDNTRDPKLSMVNFHVLINNTRHRVTSHVVEPRFAGWIKFPVTQPAIEVELRSLEPTVRIRQVSVLGNWKNRSLKPLQNSPSYLLQFNAVQSTAFRLFQAITANAFNEAFSSGEESAVRAEIVEILFSKDQLSSLQQYVGAQITFSLEREVIQLRSRAKKNYSYCYGLLSLLQKLCTSHFGTQCLANKPAMLISLSELLLFASTNVQEQVLQVLRSIIRLYDPAVVSMSSFFENLLVAVFKAITLQVRMQATRNSYSITAESCIVDAPESWHLANSTTEEIAQLICAFLVDVSLERFGTQWSVHLKEFVSENILAMTTLAVELRDPSMLLSLQRFWLCAAALGVIQDNAWLRHSSLWLALAADGSNNAKMFCENHDDSVTAAQVWCESCKQNLCQDCNAILHLSKRNRGHQLQQLNVFDNNVSVNLHEGCGRLKLSWLLFLVDSSTMNGMVEFRSYSTAAARKGSCRFCGATTGSELIDVCGHSECQAYRLAICRRILTCGHCCNGVASEERCLPCLRCHNDPSLKQDAEDMCTICFTDTLISAPSVQVGCGHVFHSHCIQTVLQRKWPGPRITFGFMLCPICKQDLDHPSLEEALRPLRQLRDDVSKKALVRLEYDGLTSCKELRSQESVYYQNPVKYALDKYAYYTCFACHKAYFGGEVQCEPIGNMDFDPSELLCGACSDVSQAQVCPKHGTDYLEYKCRFCCSVAVFFCFGTTHFCAHCHEDFQRLVALPKHVLPKCPAGPRETQLDSKTCPLKIKHPPTGEEFALGCGVCRNIQTF